MPAQMTKINLLWTKLRKICLVNHLSNSILSLILAKISMVKIHKSNSLLSGMRTTKKKLGRFVIAMSLMS